MASLKNSTRFLIISGSLQKVGCHQPIRFHLEFDIINTDHSIKLNYIHYGFFIALCVAWEEPTTGGTIYKECLDPSDRSLSFTKLYKQPFTRRCVCVLTDFIFSTIFGYTVISVQETEEHFHMPLFLYSAITQYPESSISSNTHAKHAP